jgi:SOS response regulatory protein OraA/RecX
VRQVVLAWLHEKRLLNDGRALQAHADSKSAGRRAVSQSKLAAELQARGATSEQIEAALGVQDDETELSKMSELLVARKVSDRGKAGRLLISRGFDEELIETVLERHFGGLD